MPDRQDSASDQNPAPNEKPAIGRSGGIDLRAGDDVNITGDVAGRDITQVTNVGMPPEAVRRLVITVGVLVFVTAACFFTGGIFLGGKVFAALDRQVESRPEAAASMQTKLAALQNAPPGQTVPLQFGEDELSSYVRYIFGDKIGFSPDTGKARLIEPGIIAVSGQLASLGNLPIVVTLSLQNDPNQQLRVESAAVRLVTIPNSTFGWVAVPTGLVASFTDRVKNLIGTGFTPVAVQASPAQADEWTVFIHRR